MNNQSARIPALVLGIILTALFSLAAEKHQFTFEDAAALRSARAIAVAPDGETILYGVDFGGPKGPTSHEWHLIAADGSNARKLTLPDHFSPRGFMRDGAALYGTLEVEHKKQLAIVPLAMEKPTLIIALRQGMSFAVISPDGSRFALLADPRPPDPLADTRTVIENDQNSLYVVNSDGSGGSWWCPALKDITDISWSEDSSNIATMSQTPKLGYHYVHSYVDVCSASGARRVAEIPNAAAKIAWTPEGKELAFISTVSEVLTPDHVWTVPAAGGAPVDRTPGLTGSAMGLAEDPHGAIWVFVTRGVRGEVDSLKNGRLTPVYRWPNGSVVDTPVFPQFAAAPERIALTVGDPEHAENVAVARKGQLEKITYEGDDQLAYIALGPQRVVN